MSNIPPLHGNYSGEHRTRKINRIIVIARCCRSVVNRAPANISLVALSMLARINPGSALVLVTLLVISACSLKTVYNNLDYLIPEYIEGVVSLDDALEEQLERRILELLNWHRNTQLTKYADWLRAAQQHAGAQLTADIVEQHIRESERLWHALAIKINAEMSQLLPLLNEAQQDELFASIEEKNDEYREEYLGLDRDDFISQYAERLTSIYESWLGALSDNQVLHIVRITGYMKNTAALRLQRRLQWQQGIQGILTAEAGREEKSHRLRAFLDAFVDHSGPELDGSVSHNRQLVVQLTVLMANSMSDEQRDHFIDKTDDYIRMFTELAEHR
jgi:hypothetical protein